MAAKKLTKKPDPVVFSGLLFHTYDEAGTLHRQGQVASRITDTIYLVEIFEWMQGESSHLELHTLEDMTLWRFYRTVKAWHEAADAVSRLKKREND